MKPNKYSFPEYWESRVMQNVPFWGGLFENKPLTKESLIIQPVILNAYHKQAETNWVIYPNVHSVVGFLTYIYLPTIWNALILQNKEYRYYFSDHLGEFLERDKELYPEKITCINHLQTFYEKLQKLWDLDEHQCMEQLKRWANEFNKDWEGDPYILHTVHLFKSPKEAVTFIKNVYQKHSTLEELESNLNMSLQEFLKLTSDEIYHNEFMKRKFTDILSNRLTAR